MELRSEALLSAVRLFIADARRAGPHASPALSDFLARLAELAATSS
jgi:hypothetical protein